MPDEKFADRSWPYWTVPSTVDIEGVTTAYRRKGQGETAIYLHGEKGTRAWLPLHEALAETFDVIAPEHPGYGDTERHPDQSDFVDLVLHYDAFLRALDVERPHLIGTSLGAWIAVNLAIHFPGRFASITLITPHGVRIVDDEFIDMFRFPYEEEAAALFNDREDRVAGELEQEGGVEDILTGIAENATAALLYWNPRYDIKLDRRLQRVSIPSLVIAAEDDRIVGNRQAARYAELLPNSSYLEIPGPDGAPSSHGVIFEQPHEIAQAITRFTAASTPTHVA